MRGKWLLATAGGRATEELVEGSETETFWEALGGKGEYPTVKDMPELCREPQLFHCSNETGSFKVEQLFDFSQADLEEDDIFILDVYTMIFLWIGSEANAQEVAKADELVPLYIEKKGYASETSVVKIKSGSEPALFTCNFLGWDSSKKVAYADPYQAKLAKIQAELAEVEAAEAAAAAETMAASKAAEEKQAQAQAAEEDAAKKKAEADAAAKAAALAAMSGTPKGDYQSPDSLRCPTTTSRGRIFLRASTRRRRSSTSTTLNSRRSSGLRAPSSMRSSRGRRTRSRRRRACSDQRTQQQQSGLHGLNARKFVLFRRTASSSRRVALATGLHQNGSRSPPLVHIEIS